MKVVRAIVLFEFDDDTWTATVDHWDTPHAEVGVAIGDKDEVYDFVNQQLYPKENHG